MKKIENHIVILFMILFYFISGNVLAQVVNSWVDDSPGQIPTPIKYIQSERGSRAKSRLTENTAYSCGAKVISDYMATNEACELPASDNQTVLDQLTSCGYTGQISSFLISCGQYADSSAAYTKWTTTDNKSDLILGTNTKYYGQGLSSDKYAAIILTE